jgi:uncharacterized membrane protein YeaQ/YmgE (transglycosylase-associated protein family)
MGLIWLLIVGLVAGLLARAIVPGNDSMGILATIVLGIVGSFVGGFIGSLFSDGSVLDFSTSGLLLSIVGAIIALLIYRQVRARA